MRKQRREKIPASLWVCAACGSVLLGAASWLCERIGASPLTWIYGVGAGIIALEPLWLRELDYRMRENTDV